MTINELKHWYKKETGHYAGKEFDINEDSVYALVSGLDKLKKGLIDGTLDNSDALIIVDEILKDSEEINFEFDYINWLEEKLTKYFDL